MAATSASSRVRDSRRGGCERWRRRPPYPQVYRASAWRWCKRRTPTAIGVDGVRTVECERARRTVDAACREPLLSGGVGGQQPESAHERCARLWRRRFLRAAENDFEGTRTTIPRVRAETGQGGDGGALVFVHAVARIPASASSTGAIPGPVVWHCGLRRSVWKETRRESRTVRSCRAGRRRPLCR